MAEESKSMGLLMKLRKFFNYDTLKEFREDWNRLSDEDKEWFKKEIAEITVE